LWYFMSIYRQSMFIYETKKRLEFRAMLVTR
jgi:hypothetical protein